MKAATRFELRPIAELIPYANNAKTHPPKQIEALRRSLQEFGFVSPVVIDEAGNVIAGHGRLLAAQANGETMAPCVIADYLTEEQRRAYILAENNYLQVSNYVQGAITSADPEDAAKWLLAQDRLTKQILTLGDELGLTPNARRARGLTAPR